MRQWPAAISDTDILVFWHGILKTNIDCRIGSEIHHRVNLRCDTRHWPIPYSPLIICTFRTLYSRPCYVYSIPCICTCSFYMCVVFCGADSSLCFPCMHGSYIQSKLIHWTLRHLHHHSPNASTVQRDLNNLIYLQFFHLQVLSTISVISSLITNKPTMGASHIGWYYLSQASILLLQISIINPSILF